MTTIIVTHEDNETDEFGFDTGDQIISIGRRSSNDVCIPSLSVSGVHARITIDSNGALIEDNNSTNGTYINGRLISRQLINESDEIVIGKTRVVVRPSNNIIDISAAEPPTLSAMHTDAAASNANHINPSSAVLLNDNADMDLSFDEPSETFQSDSSMPESPMEKAAFSDDEFDDGDDSYIGEPSRAPTPDHFDDRPMTLSEKAKLALGRDNAPPRNNGLRAVAASGLAATSASAAASRAFANDSDTAVAEAPAIQVAPPIQTEQVSAPNLHPLDDIDDQINERIAQPTDDQVAGSTVVKPAGAVIEIQNGAKSGQVLPIDKPVTTLGRPGIQIAAIMRKPDGYFLMHIESDDSVDMPTLNRDTIGDDPVMLHSGDRLNVAGIDVEFMLS